MKQYLLPTLVSILLVSTFSLGAQQKTRVFDSFGAINAEDASARLDNFAIALMHEPYHVGYIVAYGPEGESGGTGKFLLAAAKNYLINSRGIDQDRVQTIYAGRYKDPLEIYAALLILPPGAATPTPKRYKEKLKTFSGKMFESGGGDYFAYDDCCGVGFGNYQLAAFADVLRNQPQSVAYLIAFNVDLATPGTWRRAAKLEAEALQEKGVNADRIKIIFGGVRKGKENEYGEARLEHWILPADAAPPLKESKPEPTPKEAVRFGKIDTYFLADAKEERRIYQGLADVLAADNQLRICFIIRSALPTGNDYPDLKKVDEVKLVEIWKSELKEKSGIKEHRIFVINLGPGEDGVAAVEVWLVPIGAALPDPNAPEIEDPADPLN